MTEVQRKLLETITGILEKTDDARLTLYRPPIPGPDEDGWATHLPGKTTYVLMVMGPETDLEKDVSGQLSRACGGLYP
jgi:hypothetical protein